MMSNVLSKVLRSNRAYDLSSVDFFGSCLASESEFLIFVKKRLEFYDVLAYDKEDMYFWHYKFPLSYDYDGICDLISKIH